MKRLSLFALFSLAIFASVRASAAGEPPARAFRTILSGASEVPAVETDAAGAAAAVALPFGQGVVTSTHGLEDIQAAHIHLASEGQNGPVVVSLFGNGPVTRNGLLSLVLVQDDDLVGPLAGQTVDDLVEEIRNGNAYINVHTAANPGGELRGQLTNAGR